MIGSTPKTCARIGPVLNPLFDLSGLKPILCRDCGPADYPEVGAPKLGFMLFASLMLNDNGPSEGVTCKEFLPITMLAPRFEVLPSFKFKDFWVFPFVEF